MATAMATGHRSTAYGYGVAAARRACQEAQRLHAAGPGEKLVPRPALAERLRHRCYSYNQIPYDLRSRYDLDPRDRYYYGDGYLYQVDPRTHADPAGDQRAAALGALRR